MSKRGPIKHLDHNNWDQEEEPEEAGVFNIASQEAMQKRVIKVAKRKAQPSPGAVAGAFSGFSGFSSANNNSSFQLSKSAPLPKFSLSATSSSSPAPATGSMNGSFVSSKIEEGIVTRKSSSSSVVSMPTATTSASGSSLSGGEASGRSSEYYRKLKALNTNVTSWITMHVNKNPCCILTPIFRDYERYLGELEKNYPSVKSVSRDSKASNNSPSESGSNSVSKNIPSETITSVGQSSSKFHTSSAATGNAFSSNFSFAKGDADQQRLPSGPLHSSPKEKSLDFGITTTATSSTSTATTTANSFFGLQFSSTNTTLSSSPSTFKFGFGKSNPFQTSTTGSTTSTSGFSFAVGPTTQNPVDNNAAEEEYVPPQAEVNEIVEDDAFYTKRCKLFYKKEDTFAERGLGILYLKKVGEKIQLLIRADTSLGTILLNIMLNSDNRMQRKGKNNILFCCVPNPPIDLKATESTEPVMMMVRVKTSEDADELLSKMQQDNS